MKHVCTLMIIHDAVEMLQGMLESFPPFMNLISHHVYNFIRVLMTETFSKIEDTTKWYGEDWNSLRSHLPNNFAFISDVTRDTSATVYKEIVDKWMLHMPAHAMGQASWFLSNHDRSRIASRFEGGRHESMAIMSMLLPGVAMIYYVRDI
jgi:glycosidase